MGRKVLLAAVLSLVLATMPAAPALAQLSGDDPPPPKYQVKEDGSLIIGGDVVVSCYQIGQEDPYLQADGPEARACEAAGFGTAAGPPSSGASTSAVPPSALPETGGSDGPAAALVPLATLALLTLLVGSLLALGVVRRDYY